jgi:hypothetical protein
MQSCRPGRYTGLGAWAVEDCGVVGGRRPVASGEMILGSVGMSGRDWSVMRAAWFQRMDESTPT